MPTSSEPDGFVVKYSPDGNRARWVKHLQGDWHISVTDLAITPSNDVFITGTMFSNVIVDGVTLFSTPGRTGNPNPDIVTIQRKR